jgi:hypothetical protein
MKSTTTLGSDDVVKLAARALRASDLKASNAQSVALSIATAAFGIPTPNALPAQIEDRDRGKSV